MDEREVEYVKGRCSPVSGIVYLHSSRNADLWSSRGTEQPGDAPRSLEVTSPAHEAENLGSTAISFHTLMEQVASSVKQICKRTSGSQLLFSLALFPQLPFTSDLGLGEHQQQWELPEKMRTKWTKFASYSQVTFKEWTSEQAFDLLKITDACQYSFAEFSHREM